MIARAKAALGELDVAVPDHEPAPLKLHEAMQQVLEEVGGEMRIQDLANEINDRGLYTKADHSPVPPPRPTGIDSNGTRASSDFEQAALENQKQDRRAARPAALESPTLERTPLTDGGVLRIASPRTR